TVAFSSRWPSSLGGGLQNRRGWCDSSTEFQPSPSATRRAKAARRSFSEGRKQFTRDEVAAAAGGEQLDDLRIRRANDRDRRHARQRDERRQRRVRAQRLEGFLRSVARRRQTIRAQTHPREHRGERDFVKEAFVRKISRAADQNAFQPLHNLICPWKKL